MATTQEALELALGKIDRAGATIANHREALTACVYALRSGENEAQDRALSVAALIENYLEPKMEDEENELEALHARLTGAQS